MKIEVGQILKTNYCQPDAAPLRVEAIERGCVCTHILDSIEGLETPMPPHLHIWLKDIEKGEWSYLNWYDEETLEYLGPVGPDGKDKIILLPNPEPIQRSLI